MRLRALAIVIPFCAFGCSTAPVANLLDCVSPSRARLPDDRGREERLEAPDRARLPPIPDVLPDRDSTPRVRPRN